MAAAAVGGVAYPALVYVTLPRLSPFVFTVLGLALIAIRLWGLRRSKEAVAWTSALVLVAAMLVALSLVSPSLAVKAYPALLSTAAALVFGASLIWPPSLIERLARIKEPSLSPAAQLHTRRVTQIWTLFLFSNAGISAATAAWGSPEQWMLWNGLISYVLMGVLFIGELVVRQFVRRRE
jgi:uncharacterized membrane protein